MYNVLKPIYEKTGERITVEKFDGPVQVPVFAVTWEVLGVAANMAEAKEKFGGYPVLE